jgi:hypothetical protein
MSHLGFFFSFSASKEVAMTCTLETSTPIHVELESSNVPKVDALSVVLIDLPNEV